MQGGLPQGREDAGGTAGCGLEPRGELCAVRGLPAGARDQDLDRCCADGTRIRDKPSDHCRRERQLLLGDLAVQLDVGAEPEHLPLRQERAARLGHEHANGVRPNVDDPDRHVDMVTTPHDGRPNALVPPVAPALVGA